MAHLVGTCLVDAALCIKPVPDGIDDAPDAASPVAAAAFTSEPGRRSNPGGLVRRTIFDSFISPENIYSGVVDNHDGSFCTAAVLQRKRFVISRTPFR
jgi:hypothetical protein